MNQRRAGLAALFGLLLALLPGAAPDAVRGPGVAVADVGSAGPTPVELVAGVMPWHSAALAATDVRGLGLSEAGCEAPGRHRSHGPHRSHTAGPQRLLAGAASRARTLSVTRLAFAMDLLAASTGARSSRSTTVPPPTPA